MRTAFIEELYNLALQDERIWLLCGDLGFSVLDDFKKRFPKRFLNAGVAEQNMTGIAAGLALTGKTVFTYSIANFPVMRCLEQIRNDVCYHNLNVKIVAVGGGLAYGSHGYTHHGVEDLAVMSAMPNLAVAAPGDPIEARAITRMLAATPGPAYLRIGKAGEPALHPPTTTFTFGKAIPAIEGTAVTLISTGGMLEITIAASKLLATKNVSAAVLSMPFLSPFDSEAVLTAARNTQAIVTVEEHGPGGLGTIVAETLALASSAKPFFPIRLERKPIKIAGSQNTLRAAQGLTAEGIAAAALRLLNR